MPKPRRHTERFWILRVATSASALESWADSPLSPTWDRLRAAQSAVDRLNEALAELRTLQHKRKE